MRKAVANLTLDKLILAVAAKERGPSRNGRVERFRREPAESQCPAHRLRRIESAHQLLGVPVDQCVGRRAWPIHLDSTDLLDAWLLEAGPMQPA
ncbi:MAG: hypothetical protein AAFR79_00025 [Pseudomonadota bacterium]